MIDITLTARRGPYGDSYQLIEIQGMQILIHDRGDMLPWDTGRKIRADFTPAPEREKK